MDRRALIITYYFPPLGGGGVQRMAKLVKFASRAGWQFTVITADEPTSIIDTDTTLADEIPESVNIIRVPFSVLPGARGKGTSALGKANFWKRYLSALFYLPDSRKKWLPRVWPFVAKELSTDQYDLVLISIPPYSLSFLIPQIERHFNLPVVLDMRDPWTLNPYKIYPTPLHRYFDRRMERKIIGKVRFATSAYGRMIEVYRQTISGFNSRNWQVIPNGFDEDDFADLPEGQPEKSTFDIAFSGTFYSHVNRPTPLFKAMASLKKRHPELGAKIRFVFAGKAHFDLQKLAVKFGLQAQIITHGYLPHRQSLRVLNDSDVLCLVLDDRDKRSAFTVGGKVYEYLALKKPILALVPEDGEAADLIRKTRSGAVISPQKTEQIAETLHQWSKGNLPELAFDSLDSYRRSLQAETFVRFFERVIAAHDKFSLKND